MPLPRGAERKRGGSAAGGGTGESVKRVNAAESWADVCVQVPLPHKGKSRGQLTVVFSRSKKESTCIAQPLLLKVTWRTGWDTLLCAPVGSPGLGHSDLSRRAAESQITNLPMPQVGKFWEGLFIS